MTGRPLRVLRLMLAIGEEGAPYHHFTLGAPATHRTTVCTFFPVDEPVPPHVRVHDGDGSFRGFFRALGRALSEARHDVVHAHTPHVAVLYLLARGWRRSHGPPTVFTLHNCYDNLRPRNRLMLAAILAGFDRVVCCGRASLESLPPLHRRLGGRRLRAVPNGVDLDRIDRTLGAGAGRVGVAERGPLTVVAVNRLIEKKNPLAVLEAFARGAGPGARLVVIGIGPLRAAMERRTSELGLKGRVEFTGLIPREEVYRWLASADLFVSASRGEGLPVAVLEALACRRAAVLSDIPPHREVAGSRAWIPLVAPDDVDGLARAVARVLGMSREDRERLGRRGRELVERRFGLVAMHRGYGDVYTELLGRPAGGNRSPVAAAADRLAGGAGHDEVAEGEGAGLTALGPSGVGDATAARLRIMTPGKRAFDVLFAGLGLVLLAPLLVPIGLLIKLQDGGPIFYRQVRVGRDGKPFYIWKLRTMVVRHDVRRSVTVATDPRITPIGRWLRASKVDELPQLFNVVVGDMSFVGPRPEVPTFVKRYTEEQRAVLRLVPGISDLATIQYRDEETLLATESDPEQTYVDSVIPDKIRINLEYAARATVRSDLVVILRTLLRIAWHPAASSSLPPRAEVPGDGPGADRQRSHLGTRST